MDLSMRSMCGLVAEGFGNFVWDRRLVASPCAQSELQNKSSFI